MAYKGPQEVVGPASSTDNTIPRFHLTSGDIIQTSGVSITDADICNGITQLNVDNIRVDGNTISSTDTNGNVVIAPDGTGVVSVTTAPIVPSGDRADSLGSTTNSWDNVYCDGVSFDDGSNVLANYATGTFTPALTFGGGSTGITYSTQEGRYTRIGNVVFYYFYLALTSKGSSTGSAVITGFPIATMTGENYSNPLGGFGLLTLTAGYTVPTVRNLSATTTGDLVMSSTSGGGFTVITDAMCANTTLFTTQGFYFV